VGQGEGEFPLQALPRVRRLRRRLLPVT
jgi:hypothetical protein